MNIAIKLSTCIVQSAYQNTVKFSAFIETLKSSEAESFYLFKYSTLQYRHSNAETQKLIFYSTKKLRILPVKATNGCAVMQNRIIQTYKYSTVHRLFPKIVEDSELFILILCREQNPKIASAARKTVRKASAKWSVLFYIP